MTKTKWYQKPIYLMVALALVFSLGAVAVFMAGTVEANGTTWYVDDDNCPGPGTGTQADPFCKIQAAIDAANPGDTINVAAGTYDAFTVEGRNNISVIGEDGVTVDSANMFVDGGEWWVMALVMNSTNINIDNIVFDGGEIEVSMLEGVTYGDSTGSITGGAVRNIIGSEMAMGIGIWGGEEGSTAVDISHLTVESCAMGIMVSNAETNLDRCSIKGMAPHGGHGIMAIDNAQVTMENCEIRDCWEEAPEWGLGMMIGMPEELEAAYGIEDERLSTVQMTGCTISHNNIGIRLDDDGDLIANYNNILGNNIIAVFKENPPSVDATNNWWDDASGPHHPTTNPGGAGDEVSDNVDFVPWLGALLELPAVHYETLGTGSHVVDASEEADTKVSLTTTGPTEIYVARYKSQPFPDEPFPDETLGKFIDIWVDDPENITWPIYVQLFYTNDEVAAAGIDESTLGLYYYKMVDTFHRCSDTGVDAEENFIWANVTQSEAGYLVGTAFGAGGSPPPTAVGGTAYPPNKLAILASWVTLLAAIIVGASLLALRRRRA